MSRVLRFVAAARENWMATLAAIAGLAMIAAGLMTLVTARRVPAVVAEHARAGSASALPAPAQALASLAAQLEAISPYARTHSAPPRPGQPPSGLWIEVPAVGIDLPLVPGDGSDHIPYWQALWYPGTAVPGTAGNSYVYAHGIWGMFGGLLLAHQGDRVYVHDYSTGRVEDFVVTRVVGRVAYNDMRWEELQSSTPLLTLQTCIGWDFKGDRWIVQAAPEKDVSQ